MIVTLSRIAEVTTEMFPFAISVIVPPVMAEPCPPCMVINPSSVNDPWLLSTAPSNNKFPPLEDVMLPVFFQLADNSSVPPLLVLRIPEF